MATSRYHALYVLFEDKSVADQFETTLGFTYQEWYEYAFEQVMPAEAAALDDKLISGEINKPEYHTEHIKYWLAVKEETIKAIREVMDNE